MLMPTSQFRIFLYPKPLDMRAGYDRLAHICKTEIGMNPYGGAVFLFFNRERNRARIYFYDGSGSCLFSKRLEKGRFKVPVINQAAAYATVESSELTLLLEGVDITRLTRPQRWQPKPPEIEQ